MRVTTKFFIATLMSIPFAASAQVAWDGTSNSPNGGSPLVGTPWTVYATGGDVQVTILPVEFNGNPGYNNYMFQADANGNALQGIGYEKSDLGITVDLGSYSAGTEILFGMYTGGGQLFYSGSDTVLNTEDNQIHADVYSKNGGSIVDFEDVAFNQGSDGNYGDGTLYVSNSSAAPTPEPAPVAILGLGTLGLLIRRRNR